MSKFSFGEAIEALKKGHLVTRVGWNGKGMFLFLRQPATVQLSMVKSLPEQVQTYFKSLKIDAALFTGYICMKAADNSIVNGWLASQTDMLAEDWQIF